MPLHPQPPGVIHACQRQLIRLALNVFASAVVPGCAGQSRCSRAALARYEQLGNFLLFLHCDDYRRKVRPRSGRETGLGHAGDRVMP